MHKREQHLLMCVNAHASGHTNEALQRQRRRHKFVGIISPRILSCIILFSNAACDPPSRAPPTAIPYDIPTQQFIMHGVNVEQRRAGKAIWSAKVKRMEGDLALSLAHDLVLHQQPRSADEITYTLHAQHARLFFDLGQGQFETVTVTDPQGAIMHAPHAEYDEHTGKLHATGPLTYQDGESVFARATQATMALQSGEITIDGPITGSLNPRWRRDLPSPPESGPR